MPRSTHGAGSSAGSVHDASVIRAIAGPTPDDPVFVLVHGPEKTGKTHLACTFPPPVHVIDTEGRGAIVLRKFPAETHRLYPAATYDEVRRALGEIVRGAGPGPAGTIVIDSATDLFDFIVTWWKNEVGKDARAPVGLPRDWAPIQQECRDLIRKIRRLGRFHLVLTERIKAEYQGEKPTGRWLPRGYRDAGHFCDLHLSLWTENDRRVCRVEANGFEPAETSPRELADISWAGIRREVLERAYGAREARS